MCTLATVTHSLTHRASSTCRGLVTPDGAVLLASTIYIAVLVIACTLEVSLLRWTAAAAATATLLYTPVLKGIMGVKNLTVAFIIAASPFCGAIATGTVRPVSSQFPSLPVSQLTCCAPHCSSYVLFLIATCTVRISLLVLVHCRLPPKSKSEVHKTKPARAAPAVASITQMDENKAMSELTRHCDQVCVGCW